jgi:hypothetical protein
MTKHSASCITDTISTHSRPTKRSCTSCAFLMRMIYGRLKGCASVLKTQSSRLIISGVLKTR